MKQLTYEQLVEMSNPHEIELNFNGDYYSDACSHSIKPDYSFFYDLLDENEIQLAYNEAEEIIKEQNNNLNEWRIAHLTDVCLILPRHILHEIYSLLIENINNRELLMFLQNYARSTEVDYYSIIQRKLLFSDFDGDHEASIQSGIRMIGYEEYNIFYEYPEKVKSIEFLKEKPEFYEEVKDRIKEIKNRHKKYREDKDKEKLKYLLEKYPDVKND